MVDPQSALEGGLLIARAFTRADIPYALGGALALGVWGVPRGTLDVDVNVFVAEARLGEVGEVLRGLGVRLDPAWVRQHIAEMMGEDDERVAFWDSLWPS